MLRVLFLIENVPFRLDSRVRRESHVLLKSGASITVVCPGDKGEPFTSIDEGVRVYRYRKPSMGEGFGAHIAEYLTSLVAQTILAALVFFRHGFDVIHAANPPDILWLVAAPYKLVGKKFIYDQHDLVPELFEVRFQSRFRWLMSLVRGMERASYRLADHVISTNDTFRQFAMDRGKVKPGDVTIVRNGPRLSMDFPDMTPDPRVRALGRTVVGYLGIMNPQDHLEKFLEMARIIRVENDRNDIGFVMVGSGDSFGKLQRIRDELGLADAVVMTGTLPWEQVLATLAATDICVQPDPPTPFNRHLSMNKLMEYMALGKAAVAFDMPETRISGGDTVTYVPGDSADALARAVLTLADDPERCRSLGAAARHRIETTLAWEHQAKNLTDVYQKLFPGVLSPEPG